MTLHNLDAEQAVLGALLFDNATLERLPALRAEQFYEPAHGALWAEIAARIRGGRVVDALSLRDWWNANAPEGLTSAYLLDLLDHAAKLTVHAIEYAHLIANAAHNRELVTSLREAIGQAEAGGNALEIASGVESALRNMDMTEDGGVDMEAAAESFFAGLDRKLLSTGIAALDNRWGGMERGRLIILGGRPSMGKSTLATQIARNVAMNNRVVHFASLEMSREELTRRSISALTLTEASGMDRVEYFHMRPGVTGLDRMRLRETAKRLPVNLIIDDRAAQTLTQLESSVRATRRRFKRIDLVVVDYLQLMRAVRNDGRVNEVSEITAGLKAIAKRLDCAVVALSQLSRGVESRECKKPTLADLRESGSIEQDADVVSFVYRECYYHDRAEPTDEIAWNTWHMKRAEIARDLEVITAKQRFGPIGTDMLEAWLEYDTIKGRAA